jgi:hypothetical protein
LAAGVVVETARTNVVESASTVVRLKTHFLYELE